MKKNLFFQYKFINISKPTNTFSTVVKTEKKYIKKPNPLFLGFWCLSPKYFQKSSTNFQVIFLYNFVFFRIKYRGLKIFGPYRKNSWENTELWMYTIFATFFSKLDKKFIQINKLEIIEYFRFNFWIVLVFYARSGMIFFF